MVRIVAFDILFFLLPFVAYALWLMTRQAGVRNPENWTLKVLAYLTLAGCLLLVVAIVVFVHFQGAGEGEVYHPAVFRDGVLVPGGFDPRPAPPAAP
jgi:hypothetical protein